MEHAQPNVTIFARGIGRYFTVVSVCHALVMENKYFYFDLDFYGVGFYEEEIMTESQQRLAAAAARRCYGRGVRVLHELGDTDYVNREYDHHYNHERNETWASLSEPGPGKLGGPGNTAGAVSQPPIKRRVKYKFTFGQLCELDRVFRETQYPDALQRYVHAF